VSHPSKLALGLFVSTATVALGAPAFAAAPDESVSEVIVTATRQGEAALSKVPMSIVATTQKELDDYSIKSSQDLSRLVPSLRIAGGANAANGPNISIRGIQSGSAGAATTGIYLDDSPLQARTLNGLVTGGGTFLPILFDLQRVEVLKGPQGTLYGSSSQGGTIRYITPDPNLTGDFKILARAEANTVYKGSQGGEAGVAIGGPIVEDKLGFRGSVFYRRIGGWIDHVDWRDTSLVAKDTNSEEQISTRLSLLWKPAERWTFKPSFYFAKTNKNDADIIYNDVPKYTTPAIATVASTGQPYLANGPACAIGTLQNATAPTCTDTFHRGLLPAGVTAPTVAGVYSNLINPATGQTLPALYVHPSHTYGPIDLGQYDSLVNTNAGLSFAGPIQPKKAIRISKIAMASLNAKFDAGPVVIENIGSWLRDSGDGYGDLTLQEPNNTTVNQAGGYTPAAQSPFVYDLPGSYESSYFFHGQRTAWTDELRLTSNYESRLTWTAGFYFQRAETTSHNEATQDKNILHLQVLGHRQAGIPASHSAAEIASNLQTATDQTVIEEREAVFGEANLQILPRLKATAGVRWSREVLDFSSYSWGVTQQGTFTDRATRTLTGHVVEHPITPKFGLSYQATDDALIYATAAKGFRPGGVQSQASTNCAGDLAQLGITSTPAAYGSDSVWSFEGGAKIRNLARRINISGSVFDIEWNKPQTPYRLPTCVFNYLTNIGKARSTGFDLQGDVRVVDGFVLNFNVGYTNARYVQNVLTTANAAGQRETLVFAGQAFSGIPKWQFNLGFRYDTEIGRLPFYWTANWQHIGKYPNGTPAGTTGYAPDASTVPAMNYITTRLGIVRGDLDISIFADNLLNEDAMFPNTLSGRAACRYPFPGSTDCTVYASYYNVTSGTTFRPRMIGVTAVFRR
jgi:outer membrane receptor protein involved in Fe transport